MKARDLMRVRAAEARAYMSEGPPPTSQRAASARPPPAEGTAQRKANALATRKRSADLEADFGKAVEGLHGLSIAEKLEQKARLVEQYREHVEALLNAGEKGVRLWAWWILWLHDLGRIEAFTARARQAIGLDWITDINRDLRTYYYDAVLEWATTEAAEGRSVDPYFSDAYAEHGRMLEVVAAKYHKFAGDLALTGADAAKEDGDTERETELMHAALGYWSKAEAAYGDKAGVKTRINQAETRIRRIESTA